MALHDGHFIWNGVSNISTTSGGGYSSGNVTWSPVPGGKPLYPMVVTTTAPLTWNPTPDVPPEILPEEAVHPEVSWHQWAFSIDHEELFSQYGDGHFEVMCEQVYQRAIKEIEDKGWVRIVTEYDSCVRSDLHESRTVVLTLLVAKP